jgi:CsoR family transcriptional regulator, copper-sensing transcriptional repressor
MSTRTPAQMQDIATHLTLVADDQAAPPADADCACKPEDRLSDSYAADKAKLLARLRRTEGQVRGVARMIEEDKYCIDVLTQISAITASLRSVGLLVLQDHIRGCVIDSPEDEREGRLDELNLAIERFTKSAG